MKQRTGEDIEDFIERLEAAIERKESRGEDTRDLEIQLAAATGDESDLSEEELEELSDFEMDFPELEYLDSLDDLQDDEDFYTPAS